MGSHAILQSWRAATKPESNPSTATATATTDATRSVLQDSKDSFMRAKRAKFIDFRILGVFFMRAERDAFEDL